MAWFRKRDFGPIENLVRDQLLAQLEHYGEHVGVLDRQIEQVREGFPQVEALLEIYGIGVFSALVVIAELGEVERFRTAKQVGSRGHGETSSLRRRPDWVIVPVNCILCDGLRRG